MLNRIRNAMEYDDAGFSIWSNVCEIQVSEGYYRSVRRTIFTSTSE